MPSTYAHYQFGKKVLEKLTASQKLCIENHRDLYDIGLHGPDILFYYRPIKKNDINDFGYFMHEQPARSFFEQARDKISKLTSNEADLAYIYGFICHFALDAKCHPYVEKYVRENGVSHTTIEVEFDRYLLENEKIDALKYPLSQHIHPSKKAGEIISCYFEKVTPSDVVEALKSMNFYHRLLHASNSAKRQILYTGMKLSGQDGFKEHIMAKKPQSSCDQSNHDLEKLLNHAIEDACLLIAEFEKNLWNHVPLSQKYDHTFGEN